MHTQEIKFAVQKENGIVTKVGKSVVNHPKTEDGSSMKRFQDAPAMGTKKQQQKG